MRADDILSALSLEEKARLRAGRDGWSTIGVEHAGLVPVRMTDGPNGARGSSILGAGEATAVCVPCGSALGATWDSELVERVGALLGEEARTKACRILLAPTVNLHRSPLAGRNFECFSEDPLLTGRLAAAYVRGVQSQGVVTTVKHLAGNETEFERYTSNSLIDERALRELYLLPFELAVREGGALGVMTAYNRLNGGYCAEDEELLEGVLRGEWGFEGFVVSDWFAVGSTEGSARAGLDLEMPGPGRFYGPLADAVRDGRVSEANLDAGASRLLRVFERIGALDDPPDERERSIDHPEHRALADEAAAAAMVLLRNDGLLPLEPGALRRLAVIGPNANRAQIMGGGSAFLRAHHRITPLAALRELFGSAGVDVVHERGCDIDRTAPVLDAGFELELHAGTDLGGEPRGRARRDDGLLLYFGDPGDGLSEDDFSFRARARFTPAEDGPHAFSLVQAGRARLLVDGRVVVDGCANPPPRGDQLIGMASEEIAGTIELAARKAVTVEVEYASTGAESALRGVKVGLRPPAPADLMDRAVALAEGADAAIVVVGTNADWETEGSDRASLALPGEQDALVRRVLAANPATVVVVNAGAPVALPWAGAARAVLVSWLGGQEMGPALAAVLAGDEEPGGRLPTTFPLRVEHTPAYGNFPGENGVVRYAEGVLMGYRWYEARALPVAFPFGHGLSYTTFALGEPRVDGLGVEVPVTNTGACTGSEVVQLYVAPPPGPLTRPPKELKAFAKLRLGPGERRTVRFDLDDRAFACWDPGDRDWPALAPRVADTPMVGYGAGRRTESGWRVLPGRYELHIGRSSAEIAHVVSIER